MENQHRKISGYRELGAEEIELMNEIKALGPQISSIIEKVSSHCREQRITASNLSSNFRLDISSAGSAELARIAEAEPTRWIRIAQDHLQQGLMALTRAVAQPSTF